MQFSKHYKQFLLLPATLSLLSLLAILVWGLKPGIDLAGGSLLQISYPAGRPPVTQVEQLISALHLGDTRVQTAGSNDFLIRMPAITNVQKDQLETVLGGLGQVQEKQFTSISPTIGADLLHKALVAIALVIVCIIAFIAFAFRKVDRKSVV